ncbi:MAG: SH3 domain-containing protein [Chloroflexi bacterium]|nr:SH3 domain-containing protein [Chloroflexota bacterium]
MKTKASIILLALCLLSIITSAQGDSIRVAFNTNLRASNSLSASIIETAPAGTILTVLGEVNRWLRISRNGREVWMASWVRHERVGGGVQMQSQTTSTVDNCCFVDRQCQTDQDWADGYWAFQNNECQAPAGSGAPASSQPVSGAPAQIDNCCFVDRQCSSGQEWAEGYHAFQNNQCSAPAQSAASAQTASGVIARTANWVVIGYPSGHGILPSTSPFVPLAPGERRPLDNCCQLTWQCNSEQDWAKGYSTHLRNTPDKHDHCALRGLISILGDPAFINHYERALDLLKTRAPQLYDYVLNGLDKIEQRLHTGHVSPAIRAFFTGWHDSWLGQLEESEAIYDAAVLVHEACHVHRNDALLEAGGLVGERACLTEQIAALEIMSPGHPSLPGLRHVLANIDNPEYQWWHDH